MPFYRVNGVMMHLNMGRRQGPAQCRAALALDGKMVVCCGISAYLCDHDMGHGQTCDRPLCEIHKGQVGKNENLCPKHLAERLAREPKLL